MHMKVKIQKFDSSLEQYGKGKKICGYDTEVKDWKA